MSEALALIVDDEVQIRRFLRAGLELDGFLVEEAGDRALGALERDGEGAPA